jgi:molecular chaperone Hsp33
VTDIIPETSAAGELPTSMLYTFIDEERQYALYFLEGQKLIHDLALRHGLMGPAFAGFRDVVLSVQPLIALLKRGENFGFYIDSDIPKFFVKIETGHHGATRCMMWPEGMSAFPSELNGKVRLQKLFPGERPSYESIVVASQDSARSLINQVLADSYQVNSALEVAQKSDQSVLLHLLPPLPGTDEYDYSLEAVRERRRGIQDGLHGIFARALTSGEEITEAFTGIGFRLLAQREVFFQCACSRDRMLENVRLVRKNETQDLFDPGENELHITCEYCKAEYRIHRDELDPPPDLVH